MHSRADAKKESRWVFTFDLGNNDLHCIKRLVFKDVWFEFFTGQALVWPHWSPASHHNHQCDWFDSDGHGEIPQSFL